MFLEFTKILILLKITIFFLFLRYLLQYLIDFLDKLEIRKKAIVSFAI